MNETERLIRIWRGLREHENEVRNLTYIMETSSEETIAWAGSQIHASWLAAMAETEMIYRKQTRVSEE